MRTIKTVHRMILGVIATAGLLTGADGFAQDPIPPGPVLPPIIFPFPYVDLITVDPFVPFQFDFGSTNPLLQNTGFELINLFGSELSFDVDSGFDPDLGIDLENHFIQERFVLIDGTLGLSLAPSDSNGGRRAVLNY